jgi:AcrR family transcriptional regulator
MKKPKFNAVQNQEQSPIRKRRRLAPVTRVEQIIGAAKWCSEKYGLNATTVDRIAERAGVSVGLLYKHFPSRDAILKEILTERAGVRLQEVVSLVGDVCRGMDGNLPVDLGIFKDVFDHKRSALMLELSAELTRNTSLRKSFRTEKAKVQKALRKELNSRFADSAAVEDLLARIELVSALGTGLAIGHLLNPSYLSASVLELASKIATELLHPKI